METIYALAIGVLTGSGVWLLLRPRTFQVIVGLSLLSYAVNLFIFGMGRLLIGGAPIIETLSKADPALYDDPVPQALVLTAIVIGFATTALFLVVLLASRGLTGNDHVDGEWAGSMNSWLAASSRVARGHAADSGRGHAVVRGSPAQGADHHCLCRHAGESDRCRHAGLCWQAGWMPEIWPEGIAVYLLGGWQAPFGIVLVVDRLSAVMLMLTAVLALTSLIYAQARWKKMGPHFQTLFQFLIMGVNGAFLTGDLFNLFVFVEVLLAASYGLLLHGLGQPRVKAGLHYIAINLAGSFVFLIGVSLIYGVTGTLNMADLAARVPGLAHGDHILFETGAAILGVAFLLKAGAWPLNFWLPGAYGSVAPPVAAVFSILTKVGIYALLRVGSLLSGSGVGSPGAVQRWLALRHWPGHACRWARQACSPPSSCSGWSHIPSSCRPVRCWRRSGWAAQRMKSAALFYLVSSVLATGAFFMLSEMIVRTQQSGENGTGPQASPLQP